MNIDRTTMARGADFLPTGITRREYICLLQRRVIDIKRDLDAAHRIYVDTQGTKALAEQHALSIKLERTLFQLRLMARPEERRARSPNAE